jgi:hypothetical protein
VTPAVWVAIVSVVIAALTLTFTIYRETRAKSRKLAWATLYNTSILLQLAQSHINQVKVTWGTEELTKPRVIGLELSNTGRVELKKDDISIPIKVEVPDGKIISAELQLRPHSSKTSQRVGIAKLTDTTVEAEPLVLNPGDSLLFELFVDGGEGDPEMSMQAAGFDCVELPETTVSERIQALMPRSTASIVTELMANFLRLR